MRKYGLFICISEKIVQAVFNIKEYQKQVYKIALIMNKIKTTF